MDTLPVHPMSATWIASIGGAQGVNRGLHADWGNKLDDGGNPPINEIVEYGIPFITQGAPLPSSPVTFLYDDESDPGPYPIPTTAPVEGGPASNGDRHVLAIDTVNCVLYELYRAFPNGNAWNADSGARWPLNSNVSRPDRWTSADAAGLAILPGLVKWEEVQAGEINHAIRFTAPSIYGLNSTTGARQYIWPARHWSGNGNNPNNPPMGVRVRLKASFNISGFDSRTQVILRAMKKYGMVLADGGSSWYFSGTSSTSWPSIVISQLNNASLIKGGDFEVVDTLPLQIDPNSEQAVQPPSPPLNLVATPGSGQASFAFQPSADNGGKPVLDYTVTCGAASATAAASPIVVTGLPNGVATLCSATARNLVFSSAASAQVSVTAGQAVLTAMPAALDFADAFGPQQPGQTEIMSINITNTGQGNATISGTTVAAPFAIPMNSCLGTTLTPSQSCTMTINSFPTHSVSDAGPRAATLLVFSNAPGSPLQVPVSAMYATPPTPPQQFSIVPGDGVIHARFSLPAFTGGFPIRDYLFTCTDPAFVPFTVSGTQSPITLGGLANGTQYACEIRARNTGSGLSYGAPSSALMATPSANPPAAVVRVVSRGVHAGVPFDMPVAEPLSLQQPASVEPRAATPYRVAAIFNAPVTGAGSVTAIEPLAANAPFTDFTVSTGGNELRIAVGGSASGKRIRFTTSGVNGSSSAVPFELEFLPGDVGRSRQVSAADIAAIKARANPTVNAQNFLFDVNLSGAINGVDVNIAKSRSGTRLP
ncbi:MAG: hypothetical protein JNJ55_12465 [Betaproteobacteria bacterium]|nr:hypothetical protein [Betaproteobacteria bacterium]